jgi:signal transduction histidine kinase
MNYRASLIGASLEIKGASPRGTRVICSVPLEAKK